VFFFISYDEYKSWKDNTNHSAIEDLSRFAKSQSSSTFKEALPGDYTPLIAGRSVRILSRKETVYHQESPCEAVVKAPADIAAPSKIGSNSSLSQMSLSVKDKNKKKFFRKFMEALKLCRWSTYACTLLIVVWNLTIMVYVVVKLDYVRHNHYLVTFGDIAYDVISIGINARMLNLAQNGVQLMGAEEIQLDIQRHLNDLNDNLKHIESKETELRWLGMEKLFESDYAREWRLIDTKAVFSHKNIIDLLSGFVSSASVVVALPVEQATLTHPDVFFLYRNGLAESLLKLNSTTEDYELRELQYIEDIETTILNIFAASYGTISVCLIMIMAGIFWLQMALDKFWMNLTSFTSSQAFEMKMIFHDRLVTFFGEEVIGGVQLNEMQDQRKTIIKAQQVVHLKFSIWRGICLRVSCLLIVTGLLFLLFHQVCFLSLKNDEINLPKRIQVSQQIRIGSVALAAWAQEITLEKVPEIDAIFTISSYYSDPITHLAEETQRIDDQFKILSNPALSSIEFSKKSMVYDKIDDADDPFFKLGTYAAGWNLKSDFSGYDRNVSIEELVVLTQRCMVLGDYNEEIISSLRSAVITMENDRVLEMESITAGLSIMTLLLGYFVYRGLFDFLQRKVKRIGKFLASDLLSS
jgi:hypothetical protein